MAFRFPSGSNTFSISWESTGMIVSATRDRDKFKLPRYIQYVPTKQRVFRYLKLDLDEPARVVNSHEFLWAPGQGAPSGEENLGAFQYVDAATKKYAYAWTLPDEAVDQAEWDLEASQTGIIAQKAMTNRTMLTAELAQTSSNWPSTNTASANTLNEGAGKFDTASADPGSANYLAIKKALTKAAETIVLQTNGTMRWNDVNFVGNPELARKMGNTSEVYQYTKGSPDAFSRQQGDDKYVSEYGLPAKYASINIEIEDAVKVTTRPNITSGLGTGATKAWVWAAASPVMLSRKGGVQGKFGGGALSTVQLYYYREMETYTKDDRDNERKQARIVDDFVVTLPFGQSGFLIQSAL